MRKWDGHIAAPSCPTLVSHANLKSLRNPIIEVGLKGWKVCDFLRAVISFDILLFFLELVWSYFYNLFLVSTTVVESSLEAGVLRTNDLKSIATTFRTMHTSMVTIKRLGTWFAFRGNVLSFVAWEEEGLERILRLHGFSASTASRCYPWFLYIMASRTAACHWTIIKRLRLWFCVWWSLIDDLVIFRFNFVFDLSFCCTAYEFRNVLCQCWVPIYPFC